MSEELKQLLAALGLIAGAYLCGAIPFGLLVGWCRGVDIRTRGSGNIGATNAGRLLGKPVGILVFVLDVLKGLLPVAMSGRLLARTGFVGAGTSDGATGCLIWIAVAAACVIGHMFPAYLKFKGGKGVATAMGVLLGIYPYYTAAGLLAFGVWVVVTLTTRYVSVGSISAAVSFPIIFEVLAHLKRESWGGIERLWPLHLFGIVVAALVVYRHRGNLRRLTEGTESRIGASHREKS